MSILGRLLGSYIMHWHCDRCGADFDERCGEPMLAWRYVFGPKRKSCPH